MVRRSRDDGVVGRHLAERGVRDMDGVEGARQARRGVAPGSRRGRDPRRRAVGRRPREGAHDPPADRARGRHPERVRRHHLRQGRVGDPHVRAVGGPGEVPGRRARVPEGARGQERDRRRLPRGDQRRDRQGREDAVRDVPRSGGRAAHHRDGDLRGRDADGRAAPGALPAERRGGRRRAAVAGAGVRRLQRRARRARVARVHAADRDRRHDGVPLVVPDVAVRERRRRRLLPRRHDRAPARHDPEEGMARARRDRTARARE